MSRFKDSIHGVVAQASRWAKSLGLLRIIDAAFCESLLFLNRNRSLFGKTSRRVASVLAVVALFAVFSARWPWNAAALVLAVLCVVLVLAIDALPSEECSCLAGEPDACQLHGSEEQRAARERSLSAIAAEESPQEHIRNALAVLELGAIPILDRHQVDRSLVIVPRDHWEAAQARLWRAVYQLEGRPPTRNQSTKKRLAEIDGARDRERLTLLASREA